MTCENGHAGGTSAQAGKNDLVLAVVALPVLVVAVSMPVVVLPMVMQSGPGDTVRETRLRGVFDCRLGCVRGGRLDGPWGLNGRRLHCGAGCRR